MTGENTTGVKKLSLDDNHSDYIMGIDLGTTNSAVGIFTAGLVPTLVPIGKSGKHTMPSCVRYDGDGKFTVGEEAYSERFSKKVAYSVKRKMGSDAQVILTLRSSPPYPGPSSPDWNPAIDACLTPAEVSAKILRALADEVANSFLPLTRCVITVPAYFNQRQVEDTVKASELAGLDCVQILKEPTSAAYIYSNLGYAQDGSVLIYDLGGGTFDITHMSFLKKDSISPKILTALKRMYKIDLSQGSIDDSSLYYCRVLGTYGDMWLGGDDIDSEMATIAAKRNGISLSEGDMELLKFRCEQFKKAGFASQDIFVNQKKINISDEDLALATRIIFQRTMSIVEQIPANELDSIKTIVLVGGSTKSKHLLKFLEERFPDKEISRVLNPDETVALGAGAVAKDLYEGKTAMYQDVLPMAIGVLSKESFVDICIPKNTSLPHSVSKQYYTMYDNQSALSIELYQGVSSVPSECTHLGTIRITDLPQAPAGHVSVLIYFILSAQGRLTVSAVVDGIMKEYKLSIDSIYNVAQNVGATGITEGPSSSEDSENDSASESPIGTPIDDFEEALVDLCASNSKLVELLIMRREALSNGEISKVSEIEEKVLGVI